MLHQEGLASTAVSESIKESGFFGRGLLLDLQLPTYLTLSPPLFLPSGR